MKIIVHDENSLTNLFFSEIHRHQKILDFLSLIQWRSRQLEVSGLSSVELHMQVNFSEFGKPDAMIVATDEEGVRHVIIIEAKLGSYVEASSYNLENGKFDNRSNSALNNQLTLRYRAIRAAVASFRKSHTISISEEGHSAESPYSSDKIRRCKKTMTCDLLKGLVANTFVLHLVILTSDHTSPFDMVQKTQPLLLPIFYDQARNEIDAFHNLGAINWQCHKSLFKDVKDHFSESYKRLYEIQQADDPLSKPKAEDSVLTNRQIVEFNGHLCILTRKKYSYKIRGLYDGQFVVLDHGKNDLRKYEAMKEQIEVVEKAPQVSIDNIPYWRDLLNRVKK